MTESEVPVSATARQALEVLTVDQVCVLLKVNKDWLYDQVEKNDFPAFKFGKYLRFRVGEVEEWMESRRRKSPVREVVIPDRPARRGPARKA